MGKERSTGAIVAYVYVYSKIYIKFEAEIYHYAKTCDFEQKGIFS